MKNLCTIVSVLVCMTFSATAQHKYAVLITGDYAAKEPEIPLANQWNQGQGRGPLGMMEFWNDTYLMWEMLQAKGYSRENIFVLFANGEDFVSENPRYQPPAGVTVTDAAATKRNVTNLFTDLRYGTNGVPRITEDDFLFVWIFDHGGSSGETSSYFCLINGENMTDTEFAALVNPLPSYRKAFWMQQCHSGGFADELSATNTVFISACKAYQQAWQADDMTKYGAPVIENEYYNGSKCTHGEFNFHMISVTNQESPGGLNHYDDTLYSTGDLNVDGFISMTEAHQWNLEHNSRTTEAGLYPASFCEDPVCDDVSHIGGKTTFDYPTLLSDGLTGSETHRGIIGVSKDLHVANGQSLTFTGKSDVTLCNAAKIIVDAGGSLVIDGEVNFHGLNDNSLEIHGDIVQNTGSSLNFYDMQVFADAPVFSITGASFINTEVKYKPQNSSSLQAYSSVGDVSIRNCQFYNPMKSNAIVIENSRNFDVYGNTVSASDRNGIYVYRCGNVTSGKVINRKIRNNEIFGCNGGGLVMYASTGDVLMNSIHGNGVGVKLLNRCNVLNFKGNCSASVATQTQHIHDNVSCEIYMTSNCNPNLMRYNSIHKENAGNVPFMYYDNTVAFGEPQQSERGNIDVRWNEWGDNFNPDMHLHSTSTMVGYDYLPYWSFSDCSNETSPDKRLLAMADSLSDAEDYPAAKSVYMQVVNDYPGTVSAETALKALLPLESLANGDYEALKQYYSNDSTIASDEVLAGLSSYLSNRCNESTGNYAEAIAWYEDVITNPETSYCDSVFAIIDLGDLYLEMEENGIRAIGKLSQFIPESRGEHVTHTEEILSMIPANTMREPQLPFWIDIVTSQPEGYVADADGNVEISTAEGLAWLISTVNGLNGCQPDNFDGRTVKLTADIMLNATEPRLFTPIGRRETPFMGVFDGSNYSIEGLFVNYNVYDFDTTFLFDMGMFGYIRHATVRDVNADHGYIAHNRSGPDGWYQACLVGFSDSLSLVEDCIVKMAACVTNGSALVGMNRNSTVRNCAYAVDWFSVRIGENGAGLVMRNLSEGGYADAEVVNCYFYGGVLGSYSEDNEAGIVCFNETAPVNNGKKAVVRNCHAELLTEMFCWHGAVGGIVANNSEGSLVEYCYADLRMANVELFGINNGEVSGCIDYVPKGGRIIFRIA